MSGNAIDYAARARQLLAEASVIAEASAAGLSEPTSHSKPDSGMPIRRGQSTLEEIRWALGRSAPSLKERVENAEKLLLGARQRKRPEVDCQTRDGRLQVGREARDLTDEGQQGKEAVALVAWRYGYSVKHVYKLRAEYDAFLAQTGRAA